MRNNKLVLGFMVVAGVMVVIAGSVNLIRGIASNELWAIACAASLLIFAGVLAWTMKPSKKPVEERLTDPVYVELRTYLRETLLPAGFKEVQEASGLVCTATYSLEDLSVRLGKDLRENLYFFGVASKSNVLEINGESVNSPKYDDIDEYGGDVEGFKGRVRKKLTDWLARNMGIK